MGFRRHCRDGVHDDRHPGHRRREAAIRWSCPGSHGLRLWWSGDSPSARTRMPSTASARNPASARSAAPSPGWTTRHEPSRHGVPGPKRARRSSQIQSRKTRRTTTPARPRRQRHRLDSHADRRFVRLCRLRLVTRPGALICADELQGVRPAVYQSARRSNHGRPGAYRAAPAMYAATI